MPNGAIPPGKVPVDILARNLAAGEPLPPEVLAGPAIGEDACAIAVPAGVLVVAADPITFTGAGLGRAAVIVNANDVAVTGARPRWFLATVLLPPGTEPADVDALFAAVRAGLAEVGATLVGGHTEVTPVVSQPVVAGQMLGMAERLVRTSGVSPGDTIVQVGRCPVEGAAVLAAEASTRLASLDPAVLEAAARAADDPGISVVASALAAVRLGASALHDPTEGGLAAGLHELARASNVQLVIDTRRVMWFQPGVAVCEALDADPLATLASGALLAAFPADRADAAVADLSAAGWPVAVLGSARPGTGVVDTAGRPIPWPARDEVARVLAG
jgi:hydrogenase expression/formation protein HypE